MLWLFRTWIAVMVVATLVACGGVSDVGGVAPPDTVDIAGVEDTVPGRVLVRFTPGASAAARQRALNAAGAEQESTIEQIGVMVTRVPEHAMERVLAALQRNPLVEFAELDTVVHADAEVGVVPNDPWWAYQWGIRQVEAPRAWATTRGSASVVIAILDTGVNPVPDLVEKLVPGRNVLTGTSDVSDNNGHGTLSAGVAAASTDNGMDVAGYCWSCSIMPVKVMESSSGTMSDLARGVIWAADNGAAVISMSVSGSSGTNTMLSAVRYARDRDVVLVAAAGNSGNSTARYPAAYAEVIGVAGTDSSDVLYAWSNYGDWVDVAAPGFNRSTTKDGGVTSYAGTSSATPAAAGVLGLARATGASAAQAREALQQGPVPLSSVRYGRIDANRMLQWIGTPPPPSEPGADPGPEPDPDPDPDPDPAPAPEPTPEPDPEPDPEPTDPSGPPCAACDTYRATLSAGNSHVWPYVNGSGYQVTDRGVLQQAWLRGPAGADFDLHLERQNPAGRWTTVATSNGSGSDEEIHFLGRDGTYRWRVIANTGAGEYTLYLNLP